MDWWPGTKETYCLTFCRPEAQNEGDGMAALPAVARGQNLFLPLAASGGLLTVVCASTVTSPTLLGELSLRLS